MLPLPPPLSAPSSAPGAAAALAFARKRQRRTDEWGPLHARAIALGLDAARPAALGGLWSADAPAGAVAGFEELLSETIDQAHMASLPGRFRTALTHLERFREAFPRTLIVPISPGAEAQCFRHNTDTLDGFSRFLVRSGVGPSTAPGYVSAVKVYAEKAAGVAVFQPDMSRNRAESGRFDRQVSAPAGTRKFETGIGGSHFTAILEKLVELHPRPYSLQHPNVPGTAGHSMPPIPPSWTASAPLFGPVRAGGGRQAFGGFGDDAPRADLDDWGRPPCFARLSDQACCALAVGHAAYEFCLRGGEPGIVAGGDPDPSRDLTLGSIAWRGPSEESRGRWWGIAMICAIKDAHSNHQRVPTPFACRCPRDRMPIFPSPTCSFCAIREHWLRRVPIDADTDDEGFLTDPAMRDLPLFPRAPTFPSPAPDLGPAGSSWWTAPSWFPAIPAKAWWWTTDQVAALAKGWAPFVGLLASDVGAKSFRIKCATDLFAAHGEGGADLIRRRGRWDTDMWRIYARASVQSQLDFTSSLGQDFGSSVEDLRLGWHQPGAS